MINRVVLVGRLTKDPELRYTPSGLAVVRFIVAVNRQFSNQSGEKEADFVPCIAWRKQAENLANYQRKGNLIGIEGRIQTGSYEGQDGKRVYTTEVVADNIQYLESKREGRPSQEPPAQPSYNQQPSSQTPQPQHDPFQSSQAEQTYEQRLADYRASSGTPPPVVSEDDLPF